MNMKMILGIIGLSVIILSATGFLNSISDKYDSTANMTGFNNTETRLEKINELANETYIGLFGDDIEEKGVSVIFTITKMGWSSMKLIWHNINLFIGITRDSYNIMTIQEGLVPIGATGWLILSILSIFFVAVLIWAVSALMKWYL